MHEYYETFSNNYPPKNIDEINTQELSIASKDEITYSSSNKPIIGTHSLATCLSIIINDCSNQYALCHVLNNYKQLLCEMLEKFTLSKNINITLIPGYYTTIEKINEIITFLKSFYPEHKFNITIKNLGNYKSANYDTIDFAYDTRTGEYLKPNYDEIISNERTR